MPAPVKPRVRVQVPGRQETPAPVVETQGGAELPLIQTQAEYDKLPIGARFRHGPYIYRKHMESSDVGPAPESAQAEEEPKFIRSHEEYDKLPPGTSFVWPNGQRYRKPGGETHSSSSEQPPSELPKHVRTDLPLIRSQEEHDQLPSGAYYLHPNSYVYKKL
jgi:hypothetical protein